MKLEMPKGLLLGLSIVILFSFLELYMSSQLSNAQGDKYKSRNFVDASSNNFPPMNMLDKDGNLIGFGRELSDAVLKAIGGEVTHIHSDNWIQVLEWLDSSKADFIHDTGYTKDRDEFLDYSAPIIEMPEVIFVRPDQYDITGLNSLKGKTVACVNKHITHLYLQTFPEINCYVVKTPVEGLYELVAGKVDAFVYPKQIVLYFSQNLKLRDKIKITGKSLRTLTWSMVVKEGDKELLRLLNEGIAKVRESGEYERIYNKWWGRKILAGYSKGELQVITAVTTGVTLLVVLAISLIFFNRKIQRGKRDLEREIIVRKQGARELRESEEKYRGLFNDALDMIHIVDENGRIIDVNPIELETMEYTREEYLGKPLFEIIHPDYLMITKETFASVSKGEGLKAYETALLTKSGQKIDVEVSAVPQIESGEIVGTRAIIRDITERKQADKELEKHRKHLEELVRGRTAELDKRISEAEQLNSAMVNLMEDLRVSNDSLEIKTQQLATANKELDAFAYSVSHDLRSPLRAIDGFSQMLTEDHRDKLDKEGQYQLDVIQSSARQMGQLIDDLLAFSRLGRKELRMSDINIRELAEEVIKQFQIIEPERTMRLKVDALPPATGDRSMIREVFVNLLSNALKYTAPREAAVIEVSGKTDGNESIYSVRDNGVGFDMKYAGKLFKVFQRLHSVEEFEGTGIGLALVQRIISRHGGRVWAEGQVNQGATFYFALPTRKEKEDD